MNRLKVTSVSYGSYADQIGIRKDDILDSLNGTILESVDGFLVILDELSGEGCELKVIRGPDLIKFGLIAQALGIHIEVATVDDAQYSEMLTDAVLKEKAQGVVVSTSPFLPGYEVTEALDIVSSECVFGMNILKEILVAVRDVVGGRSATVQKIMRESRQTCLQDIKMQAAALDAQGVVSLNFSYTEMSGGATTTSMLVIAASGTAVKAKKQS